MAASQDVLECYRMLLPTVLLYMNAFGNGLGGLVIIRGAFSDYWCKFSPMIISVVVFSDTDNAV